MKPFCRRCFRVDYPSPPTRGRGLKQGVVGLLRDAPCVAPHAGAWIETTSLRMSGFVPCVAPHAGAWIETLG